VSFLRRSANLIVYEWRRALAKKKFYLLVILAFVLQIGVLALFNYLFTNPPPQFPVEALLEGMKPLMWIVGALGPQNLFMPLIAIIIAGGSMSEEYEHGTADILLSKPITKLEYITGKYLGGLTLLSFVVALTTALGVILSFAFFGPQESLQFVPHLYAAIVYANLIFFSLAFMLSEVFRGSTLAMLAAIGILVASIVISSFLSIMYGLTGGQQIYMDITKLLPNWSASSFPSFLLAELVTVPTSPFLTVQSGEVFLAGAIIAVYTAVSILIAALRLVRSDVTKKAD